MKARPEFWRQMVASFHVSKQSQRAFAEANGVKPSTLRYWLRRYSQDSPTAGHNEASAKPAPSQVGPAGRVDRYEDTLSSIQRLEGRLERIETLPRVLDEAHQLMDQMKGLAEEVEELRQDTILRTDQLEATEYALSDSHLDDRLLLMGKDLAQLTKDFHLLSARVEERLAKLEQNIRAEAITLFDNLSSAAQANLDKIYEYFSVLPAEVLDSEPIPQEFDSEIFGEEFSSENQAEHQLVSNLLSDPRFSEPLLLEDLEGRLTTVERVWQELEDDEVPRRLRRLEVALTRERASSALKQTERRIAYAQEHGPGLVRLKLTITMSPDELCASLRNQKECYLLSTPTAQEILNHLQASRILVLQGPPGTGKSLLARSIAEILISGVDGGTPFSVVPMHPELSHYDFIGGQKPIKENGKDLGFGPHLGHLTQAILAAIEAQGRHWLILDEINRGDISALMSSVLDGLQLGIGELSHDYLFMRKSDTRGILPIPGTFRIIGTMNTFDEDQLFKFSEALHRRIGFVSLPPLSQADENFLADRVIAEIIEGRGEGSPASFKQRYNIPNACAQLFELVGRIRSLARQEPQHVFRFCEIGSGIVLKTLEHTFLYIVDNHGKNIEEVVDLAVASVLLSHLANRDIELLEGLRELAFPAPQFRHCRQKLEERIRELQVF
jgi:transposase-like protein/energy-coupling factor transporter ATP-binding protein EcfA2